MSDLKYIADFEQDAIKVFGSDNVYDGYTIDDTLCAFSDSDSYEVKKKALALREEHHRDGLQLIPTGKEHNAQYYGATAINNTINDCQITSLGKLQTIFGSDGGQHNLTLTNNILDTQGQHFITVNGVFSGSCENNRDMHGKYVPCVFDSMRIGGGLPNNFYVTSFKNHTYEPIKHDQPITDLRGLKHDKNATYVDNFDLDLWRSISEGFADEYADAPKDQRIQVHFDKVMNEYNKTINSAFSLITVDNYLRIPNYTELTKLDLSVWDSKWPNFKPYELSSRDFSITMYIPALDALQAIRTEWGKPLHINSAWRNANHNHIVGGKKNSDHTWLDDRDINASAFDVHIDSIKDGKALEKLAIKHGFNAIGRYRKSKFIHFSMRKPKPNGKIYQWGYW